MFAYIYISKHRCFGAVYFLCPILLTWFNFNPGMDEIGILRGYAIRSGRRPEGSQNKYIVDKTIVKLCNYNSIYLPNNGLPTRAWRRQPSHQLDKGSRGPNTRAFIEYHWDCTETTIVSFNIYGVIHQKWVTNCIKSNKESIDWRCIIAVHSRCQGVVGCLAHVRAYSVKQLLSYYWDFTIAVLVTTKSP